ncbi:MAG: hypothetical protein EBV23_14710 [Flavobacteriia bacterium]|nr:hypothetical protein [Flavobacteriia bacterium]
MVLGNKYIRDSVISGNT